MAEGSARVRRSSKSPELWGVERFDPSAIVIRLAVKTRPGRAVGRRARAPRASLKAAFDEAGIVIPFPQQTVWLQGPSGAGTEAGGDDSASDAGD